jgi:hypothetical protein
MDLRTRSIPKWIWIKISLLPNSQCLMLCLGTKPLSCHSVISPYTTRAGSWQYFHTPLTGVSLLGRHLAILEGGEKSPCALALWVCQHYQSKSGSCHLLLLQCCQCLCNQVLTLNTFLPEICGMVSASLFFLLDNNPHISVSLHCWAAQRHSGSTAVSVAKGYFSIRFSEKIRGNIYSVHFFLVVLGFKFKVSHLLDRHSTI